VTSESPTRVLAVDHGDRRTGLAISDPLGITAQPLDVIRERDQEMLVQRVADVAKSNQIGIILLGLPLSMDGSEGDRVKITRAFGDKLAALSGLPIEYLDERLTSKQAEQVMIGRKRREKRATADAIAAQILLQSFLDRNRKGA
jgi:putative Holliday junction resolvase